MEKTVHQIQAELDREIAYTRKLNDKIENLRERLKNSISKTEHEKIVNMYERKLSEINLRLSKSHNERGAGRKKIATREIAARIIELSGQGLSQAKIASKLYDESQIKIGRTTVGEIVRGRYTPLEMVSIPR